MVTSLCVDQSSGHLLRHFLSLDASHQEKEHHANKSTQLASVAEGIQAVMYMLTPNMNRLNPTDPMEQEGYQFLEHRTTMLGHVPVAWTSKEHTSLLSID